MLRAAAVLVLVATGAYVALPVWAPTGLIKGYIAGEMSRQMGVEVQIAGMSLSWSDGVELRDLRIAAPEGFPTQPMVLVERIRTDLAPLDILFHKRIEWMVLERPHVFVDVNPDGTVNLAVLENLRFDVEAQRISVRRADAVIHLPPHDTLLRVRISDAEYIAGRLQKLGRVTVSAELDQKGRPAPVSLRLSAGSEQIVAADAIFNFANIDMGQLQLPKLLGLPLRKLSGICRGSLNLQIDRQGMVDQFSFDLQIRQLDVQPAEGPDLPIIDEAHLRIAAAYDPLTGHLDVQSASVRLPGVDLAGRGSVFTDNGKGRWPAVKVLELEGQVHPKRLAALLTGRGELAGGLEVDGPLRVRFSMAHEKALLTADVTIDGSLASIRRHGREIKPPGARLDISLALELDPRNWQLRVDKDRTRVVLGENTFGGGGTVRDVRRLVELLDPRKGAPSVESLLRCLGLLDCDGSWEIRDLQSLRRLLPPSALPLGPVRLQGRIAGKWSVTQSASTHVQIGVSVPAETQLTIGDLFVKEAAAPLALDVSAEIESPGPTVRGFAAELAIGEGRIGIDDGTLTFAADEGDGRKIEATGRFSGENVESILASIPGLARPLGGAVRGKLKGRYHARLAGTRQLLGLRADLRDLDLDAGRFFHKPAGREATLTGELIRDQEAAWVERYRLALTTRFTGAEITVELTVPEIGRLDAGFAATVKGRIEDARRAADSLPLVAEALSGGRVSGPMTFTGAVLWREGRATGQVSCNADDLSFVTAGRTERSKERGVPLRAHLRGGFAQSEDGRILAKVDEARVRFGGSRLEISGEATVGPSWRTDEWKLYPPPGLEAFNADARIELSIDDSLTGMVPELGPAIRRHGVGGTVAGSAELRGSRDQLSILSHFDANALTVEHFHPPSEIESLLPRRIKLGTLVKPKDLPAQGDLELTIAGDLSRVQVNNFRAQVGGVSLLADALWRRADAGDPSGTDGQLEAHLAVHVKRAETLAQLAPSLEPYQLHGDLFLECQLADDPRGGPRIEVANFRTDRCGARYRGKDVEIAGELSLRDVRPSEDANEVPHVGHLRTDGLELRAGKNRCWLIADLTGIPDRIAGEFHLLAEHLDDKDLLDWLSTEREPLAPPDEDAQSPSPDHSRPREVKTLEERTGELIDDLRTYLLNAQVRGRVSIEHLRTFDPSVDRVYEARQVEVRMAADRGHTTLAYAAGLNGGTMRTRYDVRLADPAPIVAYETSMRDVIATENIQPQLARYFPGNTVSGLFNRTETSTVPLRDLLSNLLDPHRPLRPTGTAKTIATDGLLEGRAAPKFVTGIFPGLNLAKYRYKKMTSFATFRPDGVADNDMVFSGQTYDMYIKGTTDPDNIGHYEVGVILLGSPQSAEWNHLYRLGRVPIFKLKARIEGGKMHDEEINYLWPTETLRVIFLENNIFYRLWLTGKK